MWYSSSRIKYKGVRRNITKKLVINQFAIFFILMIENNASESTPLCWYTMLSSGLSMEVLSDADGQLISKPFIVCWQILFSLSIICVYIIKDIAIA